MPKNWLTQDEKYNDIYTNFKFPPTNTDKEFELPDTENSMEPKKS